MIPNMLSEVDACKREHPQAWKDAHTGNSQTEAFVKILAARLHAISPAFGLNGKRGNPLDLSDDALNFLCASEDSTGRTPEGLPCVVIDVIASAGLPSASTAWQVFNRAPEANGAWVKPGAVVPPVPQPQPPTMPSYEALGGDAFFRSQIGVPLQADYTLAGQTLNDGSAVWFSRPIYRILEAYAKGQTPDTAAIIKSVRAEWRAVLGLPPL